MFWRALGVVFTRSARCSSGCSDSQNAGVVHINAQRRVACHQSAEVAISFSRISSSEIRMTADGAHDVAEIVETPWGVAYALGPEPTTCRPEQPCLQTAAATPVRGAGEHPTATGQAIKSLRVDARWCLSARLRRCRAAKVRADSAAAVGAAVPWGHFRANAPGNCAPAQS